MADTRWSKGACGELDKGRTPGDRHEGSGGALGSSEMSEHTDRMKRAMEAEVPSIYFNGFSMGLGNGDVQTVLEKNGEPVASLNMSFTVAKTMSISLGTIISMLEDASKRNIMTTYDVDATIKAKTPKTKKKKK